MVLSLQKYSPRWQKDGVIFKKKVRGLGTKKRKKLELLKLKTLAAVVAETRSLGNLAIVGLNHQCADFFLLLLSIFPIDLSFF